LVKIGVPVPSWNGISSQLGDEAGVRPSGCAELLGGDRDVLVSLVLDGEAGCDEIVQAYEELDDVANRSSFHVKST
jgi:hypothetical protein